MKECKVQYCEKIAKHNDNLCSMHRARKNRHGPEFDFLLTMDINNGQFIEGFDEDEIEE